MITDIERDMMLITSYLQSVEKPGRKGRLGGETIRVPPPNSDQSRWQSG